MSHLRAATRHRASLPVPVRDTCEEHGLLLARASQADGSGDWQGASTACCNADSGCEDRQRQVLDFWSEKTGQKLE